ncbi:helix-turn-helix domain-containing protein [Lactobacillus sp. 3B(2020)]|uniref:helix-turn-helix domain-containing protein n=1 Tax=Lactobacillus sp. 3B(2020) TaxID=2695882 RepID=UPI0015DD5C14|nr:helix-turn-helix transcriptional regulator [Lactobacillus sp. 3B(2020)]QLL69558.1 helix-turn-helix domain-containing protein [Lactobacillus sp. 3B(2020)]
MSLRDFRKKAGMSQMELAKRLDCSLGSVANWENGKSRPNADYIWKLSKVLEVTTDQIFLALNTMKIVNK